MEKYIFRKIDTLGASSAEDDSLYLSECFVDIGFLNILRDCSDPRSIIVGRTGVGKTALIKQLNNGEEHVAEISPDDLALTYISNSTILKFLINIGVNLDIFFKLLWKHVLAVEIIKLRFKICDENGKNIFFQFIEDKFKEDKEKQAIDYLKKWGDKFWEETESRVREVTTKLEQEITGEFSSGIQIANLALKGVSSVEEEQKKEIINRAQQVVNKVQIRQLSQILELLDKILERAQKKYFVTIDRLDEKWVDDRFRYRLVRALIETLRDFRKVRNAKIIIAIRLDLIERVFRLTRDVGFQEEKYESLYLQIGWDKKQLCKVLDARINSLIKHQYTKKSISHEYILPKKIKNRRSIDYIFDRTMMRPRDVILFFNACINEADGKPNITETMVLRAEGEYGRGRLKSLFDEWGADYANLKLFVELLKSRPRKFLYKEVSLNYFADFCLDIAVQTVAEKDSLYRDAFDVADDKLSAGDFKKKLFLIFHLVGLVYLKIEAFDKLISSLSGRRSISSAEITDDTEVSIHPMFWRVLGIKG